MQGICRERIEYGDYVLCRNGEVVKASPDVANGIAPPVPKWKHRTTHYSEGDLMRPKPIEGLGLRNLHAIASGPIMDACRIYLPAGRLSEAEYQERLKLDFARAGIGSADDDRD
ncbi:hypothetical protein ACQKOE_13720 [Novosphingobium sp. NPDC080210]|uniref:hypothetical protein n=1 Tax=Novosphingobium sp. NPDC080210 TaxID=3390596 RepID=UPI003CFE8B55